MARRKRSRSHKKRSHSRKRKSHKRKSRRRSYLRKSKAKQAAYLEGCASRRRKASCKSDPNCSWSKSRRHCYRGKRNIFAGPALPVMY